MGMFDKITCEMALPAQLWPPTVQSRKYQTSLQDRATSGPRKALPPSVELIDRPIRFSSRRVR